MMSTMFHQGQAAEPEYLFLRGDFMDCCGSKNTNKESVKKTDSDGLNNGIIYLVAGVALAVLILIGLSAFMAPNTTLEPSEANFEQYQKTAQLSDDNCGDLEDAKNIQHLSHHPEMYQDCLKKVDPGKFKEATGKDLSEFLN